MKFRCFKTDLTKMLRLNVDEVLLSVSNEIMTITIISYIAIVNRISGLHWKKNSFELMQKRSLILSENCLI